MPPDTPPPYRVVDVRAYPEDLEAALCTLHAQGYTPVHYFTQATTGQGTVWVVAVHREATTEDADDV